MVYVEEDVLKYNKGRYNLIINNKISHSIPIVVEQNLTILGINFVILLLQHGQHNISN